MIKTETHGFVAASSSISIGLKTTFLSLVHIDYHGRGNSANIIEEKNRNFRFDTSSTHVFYSKLFCLKQSMEQIIPLSANAGNSLV